MCSSLRLFFFCPSVMYDLQNAGKHCQSWRRSPPRKMNPLAAAPDVQLVLTQLRILAGINHFWCQLPGRIYHSIWKRITCRMEKDDEIWTTFFTFKRKFVHPRERWGAGNGFLPGLKCSAIVVLEDTWNYWWISTVESKWKKKTKHGDAAGIKIDVSFIAQLERWQWEKRLAERRDLFLWTLWFTNRSPVLVTVAARRPLKCDEWLLLVGHLLALSCNQSRIVLSCLSCLCLSHSTWTVIVLAVNFESFTVDVYE